MKATLLGLALLTAGCDRPAGQPFNQAPQAIVQTAGWPVLSGPVVDMADLLTPDQEALLSRKSQALARDTGAQYVVVTTASLNGLPIEDYSIDLARHWGLGDAKRNDGLMLLVAPNERQVRVEVGRGLESRITDPYAARVIQQQAALRFAKSGFPGGIGATTDALIDRLRSSASDAEIARMDGVVG